ncbi:hypothetical protein JX265_006808 [Neoarthrinium moseri]|uniref:Uncharacterized protein n=1 Tax=Neoarthrinium moseri TaxID=1658444 RepID=A0A9P9WKZ0_9PEZI|nr:uncharacterized protein JN550_002715 [Neoarthrinium moseri]KAI1846995.1 hypothetical protein JX266_006870 [Neoarthrinium moseri]KAI1868829.1 hypothetical protein JX265_006808 [Neoarthrinium moseri]KAI1874136.1 hypothetical protein JN550_002715 [Neoarthrinium moseri]
MPELQIVNSNAGVAEETFCYTKADSVKNVLDRIRDSRGLDKDVHIVLINVHGLYQDATGNELLGDEPMDRYFPDGGKVRIDTANSHAKSNLLQADFRIVDNTATDEAKSKNVIAIKEHGKQARADISHNTIQKKAVMTNIITDSPIDNIWEHLFPS